MEKQQQQQQQREENQQDDKKLKLERFRPMRTPLNGFFTRLGSVSR